MDDSEQSMAIRKEFLDFSALSAINTKAIREDIFKNLWTKG